LEQTIASITEDRDELKTRLSSLEALQNSQTTEAAHLSMELQVVQQKVAECKSMLKEKIDQCLEHERSSSALDSDVQSLRSDLAQVQNERDNLERQLEAKGEADDKDEQMESLRSRVLSLETQVEEEAAEATDVITQWQESYDDMQRTKEGLEASLSATEGRELSLIAQIEAIQSKLDVRGEEAAAASEQIQQLVEDIASANARYSEEVPVLKSEIDRWRSEGESSREQIEQLKSRIDELETTLENSTSSQKVAQERGDMLDNDLSLTRDELKERVELLQRSDEGAESCPEELKQEVAQLKDQRESESQEADDVIGQWEASYNSLLEENEQLQSQLEVSQEKLSDVTARRESLEERNGELLATISNLESSLPESESATKVLQRQLDETIDRLTKSEQPTADEAELATKDARIREMENHIQELEHDETELATKDARIRDLEGHIQVVESQFDLLRTENDDAEELFQSRLRAENDDAEQQFESRLEKRISVMRLTEIWKR
jgi:chromosome segregation ATPase